MPTADQILDSEKPISADEFLDEGNKGIGLSEAAPSFARGLNTGLGSLIKTAGTIAMGARSFDPDQPPIMSRNPETGKLEESGPTNLSQMLSMSQQSPVNKLGKFVEESGAQYPAPETLLGKSAEMAGGMLPIAASGAAAPVVIGLQEGATTLLNDFDEQQKKGVSPEEAAQHAMGKAAASGLSQAAIWSILPVYLKDILKGVTGKIGGGAVTEFLARRASGFAEGAALGASSQLARNVVEGRPGGEGLKEAALGTGAAFAVTPQPDISINRRKAPEPNTPQIRGLLGEGGQRVFEVSPEGTAIPADQMSEFERNELRREAESQSRQTESGQERVYNTIDAALRAKENPSAPTVDYLGSKFRKVGDWWVTDSPPKTVQMQALKAGRNMTEDAVIRELEKRLQESTRTPSRTQTQQAIEDITGISRKRTTVEDQGRELAEREEFEKQLNKRWASPLSEYGPNGSLSEAQIDKLNAFNKYLDKEKLPVLERFWETLKYTQPKYAYDKAVMRMLSNRLGHEMPEGPVTFEGQKLLKEPQKLLTFPQGGESNATKEGPQSGDIPPKRGGDGPGGTPVETGVGGGVPPTAGGEAKGPEEPKIAVKDEAATLASMPASDFGTEVKKRQGGITGDAYRLGRSVKNAEDLEALKKGQADAKAKIDEAKNKGDLNTAMVEAIRGQYFREAYEAATGTGSAGLALKKAEPDYVPPMPEGKAPEPPAKPEVSTVPKELADVFGSELANTPLSEDKIAKWKEDPEKLWKEWERLKADRDVNEMIEYVKNSKARKPSSMLHNLMLDVPRVVRTDPATGKKRRFQYVPEVQDFVWVEEQKPQEPLTEEQKQEKLKKEAQEKEIKDWGEAWRYVQGKGILGRKLEEPKGGNEYAKQYYLKARESLDILNRMEAKYGTKNPYKRPGYTPTERTPKAPEPEEPGHLPVGSLVVRDVNGFKQIGRVVERDGARYVQSLNTKQEDTYYNPRHWRPFSGEAPQPEKAETYDQAKFDQEMKKGSGSKRPEVVNNLPAALDRAIPGAYKKVFDLVKGLRDSVEKQPKSDNPAADREREDMFLSMAKNLSDYAGIVAKEQINSEHDRYRADPNYFKKILQNNMDVAEDTLVDQSTLKPSERRAFADLNRNLALEKPISDRLVKKLPHVQARLEREGYGKMGNDWKYVEPKLTDPVDKANRKVEKAEIATAHADNLRLEEMKKLANTPKKTTDYERQQRKVGAATKSYQRSNEKLQKLKREAERVRDEAKSNEGLEPGDVKLSVNLPGGGGPDLLKNLSDEAWNDYLKPAGERAIKVGKGTWDFLVNLLSPTTRADRSIVDNLYDSKGYKELFMTRAAGALEKFKDVVDQLPKEDKIDFIDRIKRGDRQPTKQLQELADVLRQWDDHLYNEAKKYDPDLNYLDNHYRVLWKTIPGAKNLKGNALEQFMSKRPWRGSRGFRLRHTLEDMSEGIAKGGEPVSYNPVQMFLLHAQDVMKFVAANRAWENLKKSGQADFVKVNENPPPDFVQISDSIAKPYFRQNKVMSKSGEWYVQKDAARMIENYLSKDWIRQGAFAPIGKSLLDLKNATTAIELGFSPFHAVFVSNEALGSSLALGIAKMSEGKFGEALKTVGTSKDIFKEGTNIEKFASTPEDFKANYPEEYAWMKKKYPDFENLVNDLFAGGGQVKMNDDYRLNGIRGFKEAVNDSKYIGQVVKAIPALNETLLNPIFGSYIPRLKLGTWMREYAFELERRSDDIADGKTTREEIARQTWSFVEDRFGELNWDNLYWNRTFKSAMQLAFRSVTWKLGNVRGFGKSGGDTAKFFADAVRGKAPQITLPMAWAVGMAFVTAIEASIISKVFTGQYPWQLASNADELQKNLTFPRIDKDDESQRVSIPTYWKDLVHARHSLVNYIKSSMTGEIGRITDIWDNKDFYGNKVYNEDDPFIKRTKDKFEHLFPVPFNVSSFQASRESGETSARSALGFTGFTKAPYYISHTPAEIKAAELARGKLPTEGRTKEQAEKSLNEHKALLAIKRGDMTVEQAYERGFLDPRRWRENDRRMQQTPLENQLLSLTPEESIKVWEQASDKEKAEVRHMIELKIMHSKSHTPEQKQTLLGQLK